MWTLNVSSSRPLGLGPSRKALLAELLPLEDQEINRWAVDHREKLSQAFLLWLAEEEEAAAASQKKALWELGSKLVPHKEGLAPATMEVLQAELREAARKVIERIGGSSSSSGDHIIGTGAAALVHHSAASLETVVRRTAALGLSPEGMALLQQQAAALDSEIRAQKAKSLTEILGRKTAAPGEVLEPPPPDDATRILEVLLSVPDRQSRAALLPDAFTPPAAANGDEEDDDSTNMMGTAEAAEDEEVEQLLFTTPLRLLHAIDLAAARMEGGGSSDTAAVAALPDGRLRLDAAELRAALCELREDVLEYWERTASPQSS